MLSCSLSLPFPSVLSAGSVQSLAVRLHSVPNIRRGHLLTPLPPCPYRRQNSPTRTCRRYSGLSVLSYRQASLLFPLCHRCNRYPVATLFPHACPISAVPLPVYGRCWSQTLFSSYETLGLIVWQRYEKKHIPANCAFAAR